MASLSFTLFITQNACQKSPKTKKALENVQVPKKQGDKFECGVVLQILHLGIGAYAGMHL